MVGIHLWLLYADLDVPLVRSREIFPRQLYLQSQTERKFLCI